MSFDAHYSAASVDSWLEKWEKEIFPIVKEFYDELFHQVPDRIQEKVAAEKDKRAKKRLHKKEKDERKAARKAKKTQSSDKDEEEDDPANDEEDADVSDDQIAQMLLDKFMKETMEEEMASLKALPSATTPHRSQNRKTQASSVRSPPAQNLMDVIDDVAADGFEHSVCAFVSFCTFAGVRSSVLRRWIPKAST